MYYGPLYGKILLSDTLTIDSAKVSQVGLNSDNKKKERKMDYTYTYGTSAAGDSAVTALLAFLAAYLVIIIIYAVVAYIFTSLGLYTMAKNKNIDNAWLAWIPIANNYLLGKIMNDRFAIGSKIIPNAAIVLLIVPIAGILLSMIPMIGWIFTIVAAVLIYIALYRLYKLYDPKHAVLFLVLSIIFAVTQPFFIFAIRNKEPHEYLEDTLS